MSANKRRTKRVALDQDFNSAVVGIDGTWQTRCRIEDISANGARIRIVGTAHARMSKEEFFLVVTEDAKVKRRSRLVWVNDASAGVAFVEAKTD